MRLDSLMARVAGAYLAVVRRDTSLALRLLKDLQPTAAHREVEGSLWESLAAERLQYARLLLARGDAAEAHRVASTFDQQGISIHQLFLPASLELRARAGRVLGDSMLVQAANARMERLRAASRR